MTAPAAQKQSSPTSLDVQELLRAALLMFGSDAYGRCEHPLISILQGDQPRCARECPCRRCASWRLTSFGVLYHVLSVTSGFVAISALASIDAPSVIPLAVLQTPGAGSVREAHRACMAACDAIEGARRGKDRHAEATHAIEALKFARSALSRAIAIGVSETTLSILTRQRDALWADVAKLAEATP